MYKSKRHISNKWHFLATKSTFKIYSIFASLCTMGILTVIVILEVVPYFILRLWLLNFFFLNHVNFFSYWLIGNVGSFTVFIAVYLQ